ncbi:Arc family DNA-binding protein [Ochrobactrum daejeonense]|nr:Arc family DNA-binding protein [Brucella daejeonensis]
MREIIQQRAKENQRSMNAEIVYHLNRAFIEMKKPTQRRRNPRRLFQPLGKVI